MDHKPNSQKCSKVSCSYWTRLIWSYGRYCDLTRTFHNAMYWKQVSSAQYFTDRVSCCAWTTSRIVRKCSKVSYSYWTRLIWSYGKKGDNRVPRVSHLPAIPVRRKETLGTRVEGPNNSVVVKQKKKRYVRHLNETKAALVMWLVFILVILYWLLVS